MIITAPLIDAAEEFRSVLNDARKAIGPVHFSWYPYDSLGNTVHLTKLLEGTGFDLKAAVKDQTILDLGCADGDFAFFLESLGASVVAVDHPRSNHNNLAGINALKRYLGSSVQVRTLDLDGGVNVEDERFELTIALGLLYHLKNPFLFLESLSRCSRYCLISTRIMNRLPNMSTDVAELPVAYLLDSDELNGDNSNFWIFTASALKRLLVRSHWRVLAWTSVGETSASTPHTLDRDERAFCLLETTWGDIGLTLKSGWHEPEDSGWRWTASKFALEARGAAPATGVAATFYVPDALIAEFGSIRLDLRVNGVAVRPETCGLPGLYTFTRRLPVRAADLTLEFEVDRALPPDDADARERALIVESVRLESN